MTDPTIVTVTDAQHRPELQDAMTARAERELPARYRGSVATEPGVRSWVEQLVTAAQRSDRAVPTVETGPSLLLLGATGTGKTHQACGAVRAIATSGVRCHWQLTTAADVYARLRPRHEVDPEHEFDRYARAGLLVLDDLGAAKGSEWTEEMNYRLVNHRYQHVLPTLVTSNVPPRELASALGERVASRLTEMAERVVLKGADRRAS